MPLKQPNLAYLTEALVSVDEQTCPRWRLLVVVEPAEFERLSIELAHRTDDPRVRVVTNVGRRLAGAINTGMRRAETDFVALLLGDDLWYPEAVAVLEAHIHRSPEVDFFHSGRRIIHEHGISHEYPATPDVTLSDFATGSPVKHLLCWRRSMGLSIGGLDERSRSVGPDDLDFPWTMAEHGAQFEAVDACLYAYRDHRHGERLTTHLPRSVHVRELRRIFRKHGLSRRAVRARVRHAERTYLQQCIYRSRLDRWIRRSRAKVLRRNLRPREDQR
jgi:glycosyltransferase involved in cell wall biosynthesis